MAYFNGTIDSRVLGMMTDVAAVIPNNTSKCDKNGNYPVVYLLHGLSDNHSAWSRRTMLDLYCEETGFAVIMPEVQRGFYTDMAYGLKYFAFITEELPEIAHRLFRVSQEPAHTYIAGLSMGGYGALKSAFTYPKRYRKAACFSGVVDVRRELRKESLLPDGERIALFGEEGIREEQDLFHLVLQQKNLPPLYICCGESDFMIEDNREFHRHLEKNAIAHIYEEWAGGHEWRFWDTAIEKALHFFAQDD